MSSMHEPEKKAYNSYSPQQRSYNFCYRSSKVSRNLKIHAELQFLLLRLRSRQNMNILGRVCMNLKIHAYNRCNGATILLSRNLKSHAYNPEKGYNGATIFVIALKI